MTDCAAFQDDLTAYRDNELPLARRLAVRRHLARCQSCREEIEIMEHIGNELRSAESATAESATLDPALRAKILTALPEAAAAPVMAPPETAPAGAEWIEKPAARPFRFPLAEWGTMAAGVLVFVVLCGTFLGRRVSNTFNATSNSLSSSTGGEEANAPSLLPRSADSGAASQSSPGAGYGGAAATATLPSALRRVHKEARITVEVAQLEEQSDAVEQMVRGTGGFIASNTLTTGADGLKAAALDVRVPVKHFESFLGQVGKLGDVKAKNVSGEDITEQFSDAEQANRVLSSELWTREAMLKETERKAALRRKRAAPDTWQQRAEVRRLRIELAQVRARRELLRKISDLATISVQLQEKPRSVSQGGFMEEMRRTSYTAFDSFLLAARLPLNLLIWVLAYSPLWLPLLLAYRYATRAHHRRIASNDRP